MTVLLRWEEYKAVVKEWEHEEAKIQKLTELLYTSIDIQLTKLPTFMEATTPTKIYMQAYAISNREKGGSKIHPLDFDREDPADDPVNIHNAWKPKPPVLDRRLYTSRHCTRLQLEMTQRWKEYEVSMKGREVVEVKIQKLTEFLYATINISLRRQLLKKEGLTPTEICLQARGSAAVLGVVQAYRGFDQNGASVKAIAKGGT
ncbi:hypothetical protein BT63DRAFT_454076 [Microthyrium microscopicum]|uniref:Uncharacterized protein n=1 Tax=Microthyrium microscopicum TaxID=703497 RepID=A0A6A6UG78_9PEZI|nr:hypothetical protein BT63DRAFT_454076 [Microthyrium microscopicum]